MTPETNTESESTDSPEKSNKYVPTETQGDIETLLRQHRSSEWTSGESPEDGLNVFVRKDNAQATPGFPHWFHELAESHHIRVIDIQLVEAGNEISLAPHQADIDQTGPTNHCPNEDTYHITIKAEEAYPSRGGEYLFEHTIDRLANSDNIDSTMYSKERNEGILFLSDDAMKAGLQESLPRVWSSNEWRIIDAMRVENPPRTIPNPQFYPATAIFFQPAKRSPSKHYSTVWDGIPHPPTDHS